MEKTAPRTPVQPSLLTLEEAAVYLGITVGTLTIYISQGKLHKFDLNGITGLSLAELAEYRYTHQNKDRSKGGTELNPDPQGEAVLLQDLIAQVFASVPGLIGIGRLTEVPRTWKIDATTIRGPESYRLTRTADGSFQHERWT